jgi:hypothetical protein
MRNATRLIQNLFQCNINTLDSVNYGARGSVHFVGRNQLLQKLCSASRLNLSNCRNIRLAVELCRRSHVQIIKLTRLNLEDVVKLTLPTGTKIVYLRRDPRAIYNSRKKHAWCRNTSCLNISVLCKEQTSDLFALEKLSSKILLVGFENLASNPFVESERLFNHLGLDYNQNVKSFIRIHTNGKLVVKNPYSTYRNSTSVVSKWRTELSKTEVKSIQRSCERVLRHAGYDFI